MTNAWWLNRAVEMGPILTGMGTIAKENQAAFDQSLAVISAMAANSDRAGIVDAVRKIAPDSEFHEIGGEVFVGHLRLKFGPDNRLVQASRGLPSKRLPPNNTLERTGNHRGPLLGVQEMVRPASAMAARSAAQLGR
jgi:hypothetical protein